MSLPPVPTVTYVDAAIHPQVGRSALVQAVDHPHHKPGTWVRTSRVLSVIGEKFFTRNTTYVPGIRDVDDPYLTTKNGVGRGDDAKKRVKT